MFNKQFTEVLKSVSPITDTLVLKYPFTHAVSAERNVIVKIPVSALDNDEFKDIGFNHSLNDFLNLIGLFGDNAEITQSDDVITLKKDGTTSTFITDDISLLTQYNIDASQNERTHQCATVATFDLNVDDIDKLKKASAVLKTLTDLNFESKDGNINIYLNNTAIMNAKSNSYNIQKTAKTEKEFNLTMLMVDFAKLPQTNYEVEVKYNENAKKNNYRLLLKSKELADFEIILGVTTVE